MKLHAFLMLIGALHGFFLAAVLLSTKKLRTTANLLLVIILLIFSGYLLKHYLTLEGLLKFFPHLSAAFVPLLYLLGPLYLFYARSMLDQSLKFQAKDAVHIAPALICFLTIVPYYLQSAAYKIAKIEACDPNNFHLPANRALYFGILFIQMAGYIFTTWQYLKQQQAETDRRSFKNSTTVFSWLRFFTIGFASFLLCFLAVFLLFFFTNFHLYFALFTLLLVPAFMIHAIGYWTIRASAIFHGNGDRSAGNRYEGSALTASLASQMKDGLLDLMESEKIYRDSAAGLSEISKRLSVNSRYLSQLVNQEFHCNLTDFINGYRISEAKKLLREEKYRHWSLLGIAMEVGFNSKNTFTRVFKRHTGQTPSSFRKSLS